MLETLDQQPLDALLAIIKMYREDEREGKIDLGVGVYKTADGQTPVFRAIKAAERRLLEQQESKGYLGLAGDTGFVDQLKPIVFGKDMADSARIAGLQTPGGTGGVRLAAAIARAAGGKRVLIGTPSWPNHAQILHDLGYELVEFNHARPDGSADMAALESALGDAGRGDTGRGDVVLLHACCHNPTGVDYTAKAWRQIADRLVERGVLPIIDSAYQGLGHGLEPDGEGLRIIVDRLPEALIAYSCDKNFGMYRDRVGAFFALGQSADGVERIMSHAFAQARATWSMPPDHGGAAVRMALADEGLRADWHEELTSMRERIRSVRQALADKGTAGSVDLTPLARQNGMFAVLPVSKAQVDRMREDHAVYMAGSGRINVAGLTMDNIETFTDALAQVTA